MEVTFYVRNELINSKGLAPLRMHVTVNGSLIKRSIKEIKIKPGDWKEDKQRIKPNGKNEDYNFHLEYNKIIEELLNKVRNIERQALLNRTLLTKEYVLTKLDEKGDLSIERDFFDTFKLYLINCELICAKRTVTGYKTVFKFLQDFTKDTGYVLTLNELDLNSFNEIRRYAFETRNTKNNYFAKIISVLKGFMAWTYIHKYHKNLNFRDFHASEEEIEVVYLTIEELLKLYNYTFKSSSLEKARDSYCFACFTGLRFSDFSHLQPSNIFDDHIKLNIKKTRDIDHIVPLNKYSKAILQKYKGTIYEPIPIISSQKFNNYIKLCCSEASINKPLTTTRYIGSKRIEITKPKYEFITSHTARKTFATNSLILGMKERAVRNITGHKKEESFRRYVNMAHAYIKEQMEETWDKL